MDKFWIIWQDIPHNLPENDQEAARYLLELSKQAARRAGVKVIMLYLPRYLTAELDDVLDGISITPTTKLHKFGLEVQNE